MRVIRPENILLEISRKYFYLLSHCMVTIADFNNLSISDYLNTFARVFKESDVAKARELGLVTVGDVLKDTRAGSCKSMKSRLRTAPEALVDIHNYLNDPCRLPNTSAGTVSGAEMVKSLLDDLDALLERVRKMPFEQNTDAIVSRNGDVLKVVRYRYLHGLSDLEIKEELGISNETCRLHHNSFIEAIRSGLRGSAVTPCKSFTLVFALSDAFIGRMNDMIMGYRSGIPLKVITEKIGSEDRGILQFFLDLLDAGIYSSYNGTFAGQYVVSGLNTAKFDSSCSVLFDRVGGEHDYVSGARIKVYLTKNVSSPGNAKAETLMTMMDSSGQFDVTERDGLKYYRLKYEYLKSDDARNERILFENRGKFLSKHQMEDEYNRRARLYGMDEKKGADYHLKGTDRIASQNSVWHWLEEGERAVSDPRPLIKKFVEERGGTVTFSEVMDFLSENSISLKEGSVRTYLTEFCERNRAADSYTVKGGPSLSGRGDIAKEVFDYLRKASGLVYISKVAIDLGTTCGRISRTVDRHPDVFETSRKDEHVYISIKPSYSKSTVSMLKPGSRKEPQHRAYMRTMAIDILKKANGGPLPMKDVAERISTVISGMSFSKTVVYKVFEHPIFKKGVSDINRNASTVSLDMEVYRQLFEDNADFAEKEVAESSTPTAGPAEYDWDKNYEDLKDAVIVFTKEDSHCRSFDVAKSFDTMNEIMKGDRASLNPDSYFWLIQELLYKYLTQKTTRMEREFLRDNLAFKYESFLRNYYNKINGIELDVEGLATTLNVLQREGLLPARYSDWSSSYTSSLVNKRNRVHASRRDFDSTIKNDILQFLVLYLYTASLNPGD